MVLDIRSGDVMTAAPIDIFYLDNDIRKDLVEHMRRRINDAYFSFRENQELTLYFDGRRDELCLPRKGL